jgi:hypothetical protein
MSSDFPSCRLTDIHALICEHLRGSAGVSTASIDTAGSIVALRSDLAAVVNIVLKISADAIPAGPVCGTLGVVSAVA